MKYLFLLSLLLLSGCNLIPVVDESIVLPTPIIFEQTEQEPKKKDAGFPKQENKAPAKLDQAKPVPPKVSTSNPFPKKSTKHWTFPGTTTAELQKHLREAHQTIVDGIGRDSMLDIHDDIHEKARAAQQTKPAATNVVTQYTIASCGICKADARDVFPMWQAKGWQFQIVDETANPRGLYPRYEVRGADGSFRTHSGSLRNWK